MAEKEDRMQDLAVTNTVVHGTVEGFVNDEILLLSPLEFSK